MSKLWFRRIQFLGNISITVVAVCVVASLINQYLFSLPSPSRSQKSTDQMANMNVKGRTRSEPPNPVGKHMQIEGIDWSGNTKTLVLYVSNSCHFCTESAPFYKDLIARNSDNSMKIIAVLPQSIDAGRSYLKKLNVNIAEVYQNELEDLGVRGTPTLLLVDENGIVRDAWVGKLSKEREIQVLRDLGFV